MQRNSESETYSTRTHRDTCQDTQTDRQTDCLCRRRHRRANPDLFGGVLLLGDRVGDAQLVVQLLAVVQLLHLVDANQPVLRREGLLQVPELDVLVADLGIPGPVEAWRCPEVQLREGGSRKKVINIAIIIIIITTIIIITIVI